MTGTGWLFVGAVQGFALSALWYRIGRRAGIRYERRHGTEMVARIARRLPGNHYAAFLAAFEAELAANQRARK